MKWLLRTWVFGFALIIGICGAAVVDLVMFEPRPVTAEEIATLGETPVQRVNGTGVRVTYTGWESGTSEQLSYLKFAIYNDSWEPFTYWGHNSNDLLAELRLNGEEMQMLGRCGTGMRSHLLLPGQSVVVNVSRFEFSTRPDPNDLITAGFSLRRPFEEEYAIYWSEPITLSEEFRMAIGSDGSGH